MHLAYFSICNFHFQVIHQGYASLHGDSIHHGNASNGQTVNQGDSPEVRNTVFDGYLQAIHQGNTSGHQRAVDQGNSPYDGNAIDLDNACRRYRHTIYGGSPAFIYDHGMAVHQGNAPDTATTVHHGNTSYGRDFPINQGDAIQLSHITIFQGDFIPVHQGNASYNLRHTDKGQAVHHGDPADQCACIDHSFAGYIYRGIGSQYFHLDFNPIHQGDAPDHGNSIDHGNAPDHGNSVNHGYAPDQGYFIGQCSQMLGLH